MSVSTNESLSRHTKRKRTDLGAAGSFIMDKSLHLFSHVSEDFIASPPV